MCGKYGVFFFFFVFFFDSNYKYGCGILAKIINMDLKIVMLRLKIIDLDAKIG